jgi:hypothetical protein
MLLEYVLLMLNNGKTMGDVRRELTGMVGEQTATDFSAW